MDSIILDPLPYQIDAGQLMEKLRVCEGSSRAADVQRLVDQVQEVARPKAMYRLTFIETRSTDTIVAAGHQFTSRILRVNLDALHRFFAFIVTSGRELEGWAEGQPDMLLRFYADAINQAVLHSASRHFMATLADTYQLARTAVMNPGSLPDWPISQQRPLFALLGDPQAAIGVELTPSLLMVPTKSVSGILFPTEETFASCQLCPREVCPNRRAAYDPGLFERKYAKVGS